MLFVVFVCKRTTAYGMRISDWSSDVCSSDLRAAQSPLVGFKPKSVIVSNDSPITPTTTAEERQLIQGGFASQALGPTFISYGPMLAEGNTVIEEWESQIYGADGTLYNNQYIWIMTFENDNVTQMHENW